MRSSALLERWFAMAQDISSSALTPPQTPIGAKSWAVIDIRAARARVGKLAFVRLRLSSTSI